MRGATLVREAPAKVSLRNRQVINTYCRLEVQKKSALLGVRYDSLSTRGINTINRYQTWLGMAGADERRKEKGESRYNCDLQPTSIGVENTSPQPQRKQIDSPKK